MRREGLAQQIIESMTSTYECMLKAVHASDPAMQEVIRNLLLTGGAHFSSLLKIAATGC